MSYATLNELKTHLHYDHDADDSVLVIYLDTATSVINRLITDKIENDKTDEMAKALKNATLLLAGWYDDERNGSTSKYIIDPIFGLPISVVSIIKLFRTPTAI